MKRGGLGFRVSGFRVQGVGFRGVVLEFRVSGLRMKNGVPDTAGGAVVCAPAERNRDSGLGVGGGPWLGFRV
jgi:hypothetical protein